MERINLWEDVIPYFNKKFQNEHNKDAATIDAYLTDNKKCPAFIILPGGGYNHRANHEGADVALWLNSIGINAFVVNYRVAPYTHPVELTDAKRALRFIRYNSERFNVFPDKIGVIGFSAGAHLAGCVAEHFDRFDYPPVDNIDMEDASPDVVCLCYPVVTLCEDYGHLGSRKYLLGENSELKITLSLEKNVREDMPPVFVWHTVEDKSVSVVNSLELCKSLKKSDIPFELHIFPNGRHGLGLAKEAAGADRWPAFFKDWLKRLDFIN